MARIEIHSSPTLELLTAAASTSQLGISEGGSNAQSSWGVETRARMNAFERNDVDLVFSTITTFVVLVQLVCRHGWHQPATFLAHLKAMPIAKFRAEYQTILNLANSDDLSSQEAVQAALEADRAREPVPFEKEANILVEALAAPEELRERIVTVLTGMWDRYVRDVAPNALRELAETTSKLSAALAEDTSGTIDRLSGGNLAQLLASVDEIAIHAVWHAADLRVVMVPQDAIILVGANTIASALSDPMTDAPSLASRTDELLKALSDPTRVAMLRLVSRTPRYGKELAEELGISPGTASYHLDKLLQARLVRVDLEQGRRFYYAVNQETIRELQQCLSDEFLGTPAAP